MERDKSPNPSTGFPPPSGRYSVFTPSSDSSNRFSHDISRMPDNPPKQRSGHRRAHSEILSLPDDISFDSDLGIVGDRPSFSEENEEDLLSMYLDMDKFSSSVATSAPSSSSALVRVRHQHSLSMDGSTSIKPEMLITGTEEEASGAEAKKAISAAKLAELALVDPKRAKRIWANRQSAARSKERKTRYIAELERKVQTLQTEATSLSAQLTLLQRDTHGLTAENSELKLRLQTMEQQVHLQDALNEALKEEIHHLKLVTGQAAVGVPNGGHMMTNIQQQHQQLFYGNNNDTNSNNHHRSASAMHTHLAAQKFQQLHIHSQKQHHQQLQQQQQQQQLHHHYQQQQEDQQRGLLRGGGSISSSSSNKDSINNNHNNSSA